MAYTLKELGKEEAEKVTKELQEVLAKYDCEMGITSTINIMKRVEQTTPDAILSPIQDVKPDANDNPPSTPT